MSETLSVDLGGSAAAESAFSAALRNLIVFAPSESVNVQLSPGYPRSGTAGVGADRFVAALDDAAEKAGLLARHSGLRLGEIESIQEAYAGNPAPFAGQVNRSAMLAVAPGTVQTAVNGPIVLQVVYGVAGGSPARTIAVIGLSADSNAAARAGRAPTGVLSIGINARGKSLKDAAGAVDRYEALVHQAAAQAGLKASAVTKTDSSFNVY